MEFKRLSKITGWLVFSIAAICYAFTAEPTGSLWDCGEFILGAHKLQVVHPPGAPLFLLIGRMFTMVASIFSDNPENIAYAVNLMSGFSTAFAAAFVAWATSTLTKITLAGGRNLDLDKSQALAAAGAGLVAGLSTAFASSIWFSAVEGEVYALSTFFTAIVMWSVVKWYDTSDDISNDRWLVFAVFMGGLSIGVHLLSLLTFPALGILYYLKKNKKYTFLGMGVAAVVGLILMVFIQKVVITGVPEMWLSLDKLFVGMGLPLHSGAIPTVLLIAATCGLGIYLANKPEKKSSLVSVLIALLFVQFFLMQGFIQGILWTALLGIPTYLLYEKGNRAALQSLYTAVSLIYIGFSLIAIVVIRADANTPVNMNEPSSASRLLPYLNREQYGERALVKGPHFDGKPIRGDYERENREIYDEEAGAYVFYEEKITYKYDNDDKMLFPRIGHTEAPRPQLYRRDWGLGSGPGGVPTTGDNISFFFNYQLKWMYWRYFMWNFTGKQNGKQGYHPSDPAKGHWISGINAVDKIHTVDAKDMPETMKNDQSRNTYYFIPFLLGILGLIFHITKRPKEALALGVLFFMTGIAIIIYSNQPPNEPRERDYVLVGSFFTYCIWIGMSVAAIFEWAKKSLKGAAAPLSIVLALAAPLLMGTQNWDDHSRAGHYAARDYASNFLNSLEKNAIIFTYGDNDTYPLWYAQEVEGIRTDVRVINLSLIMVDWYINQMNRAVNDAPYIDFTVENKNYLGFRNGYIQANPNNPGPRMNLKRFLQEVNKRTPKQKGRPGLMPSKSLRIPVDRAAAIANGIVSDSAQSRILGAIDFTIPKDVLYKGELALLDIIGSNIWERPIYWAVTVKEDWFLGLKEFTQLEGLALRLVPTKTKGDPEFPSNYGVVGKGSVHADKLATNVIEKFKWGRYDQERMYVDDKYGPSIQSTRFVVRRGFKELMREKKNQRAVELLDTYFKGFPHMNFTYGNDTWEIIQLYARAGAYDKSKEHVDILATEIVDRLEFYNTLDPQIADIRVNQSQTFAREKYFMERTMEQVLSYVKNNNDNALLKELEEKFKPFRVQNIQEGGG